MKLNIVNNGLVAVPFNEGLPYIEVSDEAFIKIVNGELVYKNGQLVDNTKVLEANKRIEELKTLLKDTDYQAIKYAEGELTATEFAPMKQQRKAWREEIRELEKGLN